MKTSMKNLGGVGIIVCLMQGFEYIIMLSILFIIIENIFAMPFSPLVVKNHLLKDFSAGSKVGQGVVDVGTGGENDYRRWLVIQTSGFTTGM